jgi:hypothetical protein
VAASWTIGSRGQDGSAQHQSRGCHEAVMFTGLLVLLLARSREQGRQGGAKHGPRRCGGLRSVVRAECRGDLAEAGDRLLALRSSEGLGLAGLGYP